MEGWNVHTVGERGDRGGLTVRWKGRCRETDYMVGGNRWRNGLYSGREDKEGRTIQWEGTHGGMECTVGERGDTWGWNCTVEGQTG